MEDERVSPIRDREGGAARQIGRALRLRCPRCGARGLVRRWLSVAERCPGCGLRLDRGEGDHFLGAMALNLVAAELLAIGALAGAMAVTWPEPPWGLLTWGGAALAAVAPVALYPVSKLVWLAVDRLLREEEAGR